MYMYMYLYVFALNAIVMFVKFIFNVTLYDLFRLMNNLLTLLFRL